MFRPPSMNYLLMAGDAFMKAILVMFSWGLVLKVVEQVQIFLLHK